MFKETQKEYKQIISICKKIYRDKYQDYGTAWRICRVSTFTDQLFIKAMRIKTIQKKKQEIKDGIEVELIGLINYAILAIIQMMLKDSDKLHLSYKEVSSYYDKVVSDAFALLLKKNHDYDECWREMRFSSIIDIILMKLLRIKKIEDNGGKAIISENIQSGFIDIINYSIFAFIQQRISPL